MGCWLHGHGRNEAVGSVTRYDRYEALKRASLRAALATLANDPRERTCDRANGLYVAWDRIGRLIYPMVGDYSRLTSTASRGRMAP